MKIAFLSRYQDTNSRGVESFAKELVGRLSKDHQVDLLIGTEADNLSKILSGGYDIVVPLNGRLQALRVSLGRFWGKYKILISGHSGIGRDDIWNIAVCRPNVFVALTDRGYEWAKNWVWGSKVVKIPDGVDIEKFNPKGEKMELELPRPVILSVGALTWYKHHERVIRAVNKMEKGSVLIVGEGKEYERLEKTGNQLLPGRFRIMKVSYERMPTLYRSVDLFTLPSWDREAFGIVYLEAMASGIAVVAPNDSSRREIVGEAGILVDVENIEEYTKALEKALSIPWGDKPRNQAKKFSWEKVTEQYKKVFQDLIHA